MDVKAIDSIFMGALSSLSVQGRKGMKNGRGSFKFGQFTCGGPNIVPFQFDMSKSSPSARP